jgi:pyruvate dehydrogenase E2 component (dihydrolipoamide acetyltransferase)
MATEVVMPALGLAQETGKVIRWLKADGDSVSKGEALLEVETDKVTVEVEAPEDGVLGGLRAAEGEDVPVGEAVAFVLAPGESAPEPAAVTAEPEARAQAADTVEGAEQKEPADEGRRPRPLASPKARRLAHERGVDLDSVAGSGPHGSVVAADLASVSDGGAAGAGISPAWQRMAERVTRSWQTVPHFFLVREVDASRLNAWRDIARGRSGGEAVTHTDLLVRISAAALAEHPHVNAVWREGAVEPQEEINVGVAVATDEALVVPVVHGADRLGLVEIAARRGELVEAARAGRLAPGDVQGGTFTISNLGMHGVDAFLAIVNAPQVAILAVGRIAERIVALDGAPAVRPTMTLSLSFDHRAVDGARGARFLDTVAALVEEPAGLVDR